MSTSLEILPNNPRNPVPYLLTSALDIFHEKKLFFFSFSFGRFLFYRLGFRILHFLLFNLF